MYEFSFTADLHIDHDLRTIRNGQPIRAYDVLSNLDLFVNHSIENVDFALFGGDIFDTLRPAEKWRDEFRLRVLRLSQAGVKTVILTGNHDSGYHGNPFTEYRTLDIPNVYLIDSPASLQFGDFTIHGLPWDFKGELPDFQLNQGANICIGHCSVFGAEFNAFNTVERTIGDFVVPLEFFDDFDWVGLGHIHRRQMLNDHVGYFGAGETLDWGEFGNETPCFYSSVAGLVPYNTRPRYDLTFDNLPEALTTEIDPNGLYRITFHGDPNRNALNAHFNKSAQFKLKTITPRFERQNRVEKELKELSPEDQLRAYYATIGEEFPTDLWTTLQTT